MFLAFLYGLLCVAGAQTTAIDFNSLTYSRPVPSDFLSISVEPTFLANFVSQQTRSFYSQLLINVLAVTGGSRGMNIRIGGNSGDLDVFLTTTDTTKFETALPTLELLASMVPAWGGTVTVGLSMANQTDATNAVELALASVAAFGWAGASPPGLLESFELGNEPNFWTTGPIFRDNTYTPAVYLSNDYPFFVAALEAAGIPRRSYRQPNVDILTVYGPTSKWNTQAVASLINGMNDTLQSAGTHMYAYYTNCGGGPATQDYSARDFMTDSTNGITKRVTNTSTLIGLLPPGLLYHASEANLVCGVTTGAQTAGGVLTAANFFLALAAVGTSRLNFHGYPFMINTHGVASATPQYYALLAVAAATSFDSRLSFCNVGPLISCYAAVDSRGMTKVTLINMDPDAATATTVDIVPTPASGTATITAFLGLSINNTVGLTWAGQTWDNSADGTPSGSFTQSRLDPDSDGRLSLTLQPFSILVVQLTSTIGVPPATQSPPPWLSAFPAPVALPLSPPQPYAWGIADFSPSPLDIDKHGSYTPSSDSPFDGDVSFANASYYFGYKSKVNIQFFTGRNFVEMWIKCDAPNLNVTLFKKEWQIYIYTGNVEINVSPPTPPAVKKHIAYLPFNNWTHISVSYDSSLNTLFWSVNGVVSSSILATTPPFQNETGTMLSTVANASLLISNFRLVANPSVLPYISDFVVPTEPLAPFPDGTTVLLLRGSQLAQQPPAVVIEFDTPPRPPPPLPAPPLPPSLRRPPSSTPPRPPLPRAAAGLAPQLAGIPIWVMGICVALVVPALTICASTSSQLYRRSVPQPNSRYHVM